MDDRIVYFNGIERDSGDYYTRPAALKELAARIDTRLAEKRHLVSLRNFLKYLKKPRLGPIFGIDPGNLEEAGWGIVFHRDESQEVRKSLTDLIRYRNGKVLEYFPGDTKDEWLRRQGMSPGSVDPKLIPYYLLLVGEPTFIPFEFQYQLDVQFAVGRLSLEAPEAYAVYARSLIEHERVDLNHVPKKFVVFGTSHPGDQATTLSSAYLAKPVADQVSEQTQWSCSSYLGERATKQSLLAVLANSPASVPLLFAACHGVGYPMEDVRQGKGQGAWICQEWPGKGPVTPEHLFAEEDVDHQSALGAKVVFSFCCFGAGTPQQDDFDPRGRTIAPRPFISALPKKLLSHPAGGTLAYIGHIDRAWGYSFLWEGIGAQPQTIISTLCSILSGTRLGHAMTEINIRYAELSTMLADALYRGEDEQTVSSAILEHLPLWMSRNDARNYILLGDPAIRLTA